MKRIALFLIGLTALSLSAQPSRTRVETTKNAQNKTATKTTKGAPSGVSYRDFPTAQSMPEDVAWRRDVYRVIDLTKDANAVLYYPTTPQDGKMNLFSYLFKLLLRKQITAYDTKLDGNEDFSPSNTVTARQLMDRYNMFYETQDGRIRVSDADIPSDEVKLYYIKESVYYDQHTSTFHSRVTALCPVLLRGDIDFGGTDARYPMFWVKFDDVAPQLGKLMLMGSNYNNAATMSADDFFTLKRYDGEIYRTVNLQDKLLTNLPDSAMKREQQKIEGELTEVQNHVWGKDSIIAEDYVEEEVAVSDTASVATPTTVTRRTGTARRTSVSSSTKKKSVKTKKQRKVRSSSSAGYSVRRERH